MTTLHSFAVLAHGVSPYLEQCLESLEGQRLRSAIYLSTSTPSPSLAAIAATHNIPLHVNDQCHGIAGDWSFAYGLAKTKYVTLAHQDDIYLPDYAAECVAAAERYHNSLITFTDYSQIAQGATRGPNLLLLIKRLILLPFYCRRDTVSSPLLKRAMLSLGSPIPCPSVMYHAEKIGAFSFCAQLTINLDWEAWIRLASRPGDFVYVKRHLMQHRIHPESETSRGISDSRRSREDRRMFEQLWWKPLALALSKLYAVSYRSNH